MDCGVRKIERSGRAAKQRAGLVPACRMATHNRFFAALSNVLSAVEQYFDRWRHPNWVRRRLVGITHAVVYSEEIAGIHICGACSRHRME